MRRIAVKSSAIRSVGYDGDLAVLEIEFTSSDVYRYHAVAPSVHQSLMDAESRGHYFAAHIRDVYPSVPVT